MVRIFGDLIHSSNEGATVSNNLVKDRSVSMIYNHTGYDELGERQRDLARIREHVMRGSLSKVSDSFPQD